MKIIAIIAGIIAIFANSAVYAEIGINSTSTARYVLDTVPVPVTAAEAHRCARAYHNGGTYRLLNEKITITCTKHVIRKEWNPAD